MESPISSFLKGPFKVTYLVIKGVGASLPGLEVIIRGGGGSSGVGRAQRHPAQLGVQLSVQAGQPGFQAGQLLVWMLQLGVNKI